MRKIQLLNLILLVLAGCQKVEDNNDESILMSFIASIEAPAEDLETRTILGGYPSDANRSVLWEYNDQVYVTNEISSAKFTNQTERTSDLAVLEGSLAQGTKYYAAYPYDMVMGYSSAGFTIELPANQEYYKDGLSSDSFPMVAQCQDGVFNFRNLCGILVLRLTGEQSVSSITFSGKDSDGDKMPVSGVGTVSMSYSDYPSMSLKSSLTYQVTLGCGNGVSLNSATPTSFHLVLPVGTYNEFEILIETTDGSKMVVNSDKALSIKRSTRTTTTPLTYIDIIDLSGSGTANCYIISKAGKYKFNASVKGNSTEVLVSPSTAAVLWESLGTNVKPSVGDIVKNVTYKDGYIEFETPSVLAEGNAVIAAKNASGTILWSWHMWFTDQPQGVEYYNSSSTVMDRNLGATSATPGDVGALGLLYQWGRKDPFLGSSSISSNTTAKSTTYWPSAVSSNSNYGTISYAISHPTTFIICNSKNKDWYYTGTSSTNSTRWTTSDMPKSKYDPCPAGWRVPDSMKFWSSVLGSTLYFVDYPYDSTNKGMNFSGKFGSIPTIWYPASGFRVATDGTLDYVSELCSCWSADNNPSYLTADSMFFNDSGEVNIRRGTHRAWGCSVRCIQELK